MSKSFKITTISPDTFLEIFRVSAEGIIMVDANGEILLANPISEQLFGYETGELIGKSVDILLPKSLRQKHVHHRSTFAANPEPRRMGSGRDLKAVKKDGSEFPVEVSLSHHHVNNQFLVVAFIIDITQRKNSEEALKQSEEQLLVYAAELEKKVSTRTEALDQTIKELEKEVSERKKAEEEVRKLLAKERELNDLKTKFVSIASHEFRTPLSTILSSTSLINQYKERGEADKMDKHIQRIKSNVSHLTSILNDFLSLGKLEEGKIEALKELVDLDEFFQEVAEEIKPVLKVGQYLELQCNGLPAITSDPRMLRNIFFNLLSNASKYSSEGKPIYVSCQLHNDVVRLSIRDEGIGIPADDKKHMFERFFRASNVTNIQGTGLGLNIVKRYTELLGGTVEFESEYQQGSVFTITIPVT